MWVDEGEELYKCNFFWKHSTLIKAPQLKHLTKRKIYTKPLISLIDCSIHTCLFMPSDRPALESSLLFCLFLVFCTCSLSWDGGAVRITRSWRGWYRLGCCFSGIIVFKLHWKACKLCLRWKRDWAQSEQWCWSLEWWWWRSDEGGVECAAVVSVASASFKQLLDQRRFLLLQLSDALALLCHFLLVKNTWICK